MMATGSSLFLAIVLGVILVALLTGFLAARYRQRRREKQAHALTAPSHPNPKAEQKLS